MMFVNPRGFHKDICIAFYQGDHRVFAHPLASGDMICGWSMMKVGLTHWDSRNSPTRLSRSRATVCGGAHSTLCSLHCTMRRTGIELIP